MATMDLFAWFHPMVNIPINIDPRRFPFRIMPQMTVDDLMNKVERLVEALCKEEDTPVEMEIQIMWNRSDPNKKSLDPDDLVSKHFKHGDTFGVFGDIMPVREKKKPEADKLPVTILTGFLGSGKTTLLNYILQEQKEKKIAVIENEFGEVPIDDVLLKKDSKIAMAEKLIVMNNGCMCCTVRGDLLAGLRQIVNAVKQGQTIDQIIIETTGMADPVPIVRTFMSGCDISDDLRLDGVVTLADAKHILGRLDDHVEDGKVNEAYQQVAFCDKIILNKLDLVGADEAIKVQERLRSINSFAKIVPAVRSRVKMFELHNMRAHDMSNFVNFDIEKEAEPQYGHEGGQDGHGEERVSEGHGDGHGVVHGHDESSTRGNGHGGDGGHGDNSYSSGHGAGHGGGLGHGEPPSKKSRHDSRVNSFSIVKQGEMNPQRLCLWMQCLGRLGPERGTIFRIKGIFAVKGDPDKVVFHSVMDVSDQDYAGPWQEGEKKISKIVFIGKGMDQQYLREGFECLFD